MKTVLGLRKLEPSAKIYPMLVHKRVGYTDRKKGSEMELPITS